MAGEPADGDHAGPLAGFVFKGQRVGDAQAPHVQDVQAVVGHVGLAATHAQRGLAAQGGELASQAVSVHGVQVLAARLDGADAQTLRETMDKLKDKLKTAAIVLAATSEGKVQLAAGVTPDTVGRIKAGELVNFVAQQVGGKGGGKPDMAMAGGTNAAALPQALQSVQGWVAAKLA